MASQPATSRMGWTLSLCKKESRSIRYGDSSTKSGMHAAGIRATTYEDSYPLEDMRARQVYGQCNQQDPDREWGDAALPHHNCPSQGESGLLGGSFEMPQHLH